MGQPFQTTRRIEFRDTDTAGIAHFSSFFVFMEQAEHELLRSVGLSVFTRDDEGTISWPRVSATCDYRGAIRFEEVMDVAVSIERLGKKSATYAFRFTHQGREIAVGKITSVCCRLIDHSPPRSITIPAYMRAKLEPFAESSS